MIHNSTEIPRSIDNQFDETFDAISGSGSTLSEEPVGIAGFLRGASYLVFFLILGFPFFFGGVHRSTYSFVYCAVFAYTCGAIYLYHQRVRASLLSTERAPVTRITFSLLCTFPLICIFQALTALTMRTEHPLLGNISSFVDPESFRTSFLSVAAFVATFVLTRYLISIERKLSDKLLRAVLFASFLVSFTAIAHWFYDNGKLFWIFEPDNVSISERARWPFVNPNHLGHFLLLSLGIAAGFLVERIRHMTSLFSNVLRSRTATFVDVLASRRVQSTLLSLSIILITTFACLIAVLATQSRSTWLGLSIGLLIFLIMERTIISSIPLPQNVEAGKPLEFIQRMQSERRRRKRRSSKPRSSPSGSTPPLFLDTVFRTIRKLGRPIVFCLTGVLLYFFLNQKGVELVGNRINYGLLHSKDDIRWAYYIDTIPMIRSHPILGVGLGGWRRMQPVEANPLLSRLNPVYLHNDPLQLISECGIVGFLPLLLAFIYGTVRVIRIIKNRAISASLRIKIGGAYSGITAFLIASLLDFPFRIPALSLMFAIILAVLVCYMDSAESEHSFNI